MWSKNLPLPLPTITIVFVVTFDGVVGAFDGVAVTFDEVVTTIRVEWTFPPSSTCPATANEVFTFVIKLVVGLISMTTVGGMVVVAVASTIGVEDFLVPVLGTGESVTVDCDDSDL